MPLCLLWFKQTFVADQKGLILNKYSLHKSYCSTLWYGRILKSIMKTVMGVGDDDDDDVTEVFQVTHV